MSTHGENRSAVSQRGGTLTARSIKLLNTALAGSVPLNLSEKTASWWVEDTGGKECLADEVQKVLFHPPTVANEVAHWVRFYKFLLQRQVAFPGLEKHSCNAKNSIFIPEVKNQTRFEADLQECCKKFFPMTYKPEPTQGTLGGNRFREGKTYMIQVDQKESDAWPASMTEGHEVTLTELLARELYFYFRGIRRPKECSMYAMGSWVADNRVPALRWTTHGLRLEFFQRSALKYHCFWGLQVLNT
ncbi:MAG: hypothetical protein PHV93_02735 [Candidatus Pacebacteria bacterium]|nr:hypothetical protein [Candidatus Paceibacterota bacterium]